MPWQKFAIGMCEIDIFFISVQFWFGSLKKNLDSVWNEFGLVRFKKHGSVRILLLFTTDVIAE